MPDRSRTEADERRHVFDDPRNVRRVIRLLYAACGLLVVPDLLDLLGFSYKHPHYSPEGWLGFYPVYGFVGCVTLVLLAKVLRRIVMRGEDYYDE